MKYYELRGSLDLVPKNLWESLKQIEPTVVELTKEDYENRLGIKPERAESKKTKDVRKSVGENPKAKTEAPVRVGGEKKAGPKTRPEYIAVLRKRGFEYHDLKRKKLQELKDMY